MKKIKEVIVFKDLKYNLFNNDFYLKKPLNKSEGYFKE